MNRFSCPLKVTSVVLVLLFCNLLFNSCLKFKLPQISFLTDKSPASPVQNGLSKLTRALKEKGISFEKVKTIQEAKGKYIIVTGLAAGEGLAAAILKEEGRDVPKSPEALTVVKAVRHNKQLWVVSGSDDRGLMYGLLDLADRIRWGKDIDNPLGELRELNEKPFLRERAVSIYTMNRTYWESRFYDEAYWSQYLDNLAKNRFNSLVLIFGYSNGGFLAPCYPYFFNVDEYPQVRLTGTSRKEQDRNLNALNKLIKMAHARGISFTVGIWDHIYRAGGDEIIYDKKNKKGLAVPGFVEGVNDENLIPYTKLALAKFVKEVPDLDAIQFRMHSESGLKREEQDAFWKDIFRMIRQTSPNMHLDLRAKGLPESVIQSACDAGINFRITTKFWMEQMGLAFHPTQVNPDPEESPRRHSYADMLKYPKQYNMIWRLWNGGTSRVLLWGDPEYVRRIAASCLLYDGEGLEVNEPLATKMQTQAPDIKPFDLLNPPYRYYNYEFERYWYFFQVFGRLTYNPDTPPEVLEKEFTLRFGPEAGPLVMEALNTASGILPRIVASCFPYSGFPMVRGWAEKQPLGTLAQYAQNEGSDLQQFANFDEEATMITQGGNTVRILPSMNSKWFEETAMKLDGLISEAEKVTGNNKSREFVSTITDLKILANLSLFHSRRIPGAVNYRIFKHSNDVTALDEAILSERSALEAWRQIVLAAGDVYCDNLIMGPCNYDLCGHWKDELPFLEKGLKDLEQERTGYKPVGRIIKSPHFKTAEHSDNASLFTVSHNQVETAPAGKPIEINIKVDAHSGVNWVRVSYRSVNQLMEYKSLTLHPSGDGRTYTGIIRAEDINPMWDFMYFIQIMDKKGNGTIYPDLNRQTPYFIVKLVR